jgi:hypothetical protein
VEDSRECAALIPLPIPEPENDEPPGLVKGGNPKNPPGRSKAVKKEFKLKKKIDIASTRIKENHVVTSNVSVFFCHFFPIFFNNKISNEDKKV